MRSLKTLSLCTQGAWRGLAPLKEARHNLSKLLDMFAELPSTASPSMACSPGVHARKEAEDYHVYGWGRVMLLSNAARLTAAVLGHVRFRTWYKAIHAVKAQHREPKREFERMLRVRGAQPDVCTAAMYARQSQAMQSSVQSCCEG